MFFVFVKHYLNEEGMKYFDNNWYPRVNSAIKIQPGFVSIESNKSNEEANCVNITLKFQNQTTLLAWAATPIHGELIDLLDPYRIRDWEYANLDKTDDGQAINRSTLKWEHVTPKHIAYEEPRRALLM